MGDRGASSGQPDRYGTMAAAMRSDLLRGDRAGSFNLGWGYVDISERSDGRYDVEVHTVSETRRGPGRRILRRSGVAYERAVDLAIESVVDHVRRTNGD